MRQWGNGALGQWGNEAMRPTLEDVFLKLTGHSVRQ